MKITPTTSENQKEDQSVASLSDDGSFFGGNEKKSFCSLKAFIIVSMISLIVLCCVSVYVSVFVLMNQSVNELTEDVLGLVEEKMSVYIDSVLNEMVNTGLSMADHYNYGLATTDYFRKYFYTPFKVSGLSAGYAFGSPSERYSYTIIGKEGKQDIVYSYQPPGFIGSIRDTYSLDGTLIKLNETVDYTPYHVAKKDFYYVSLDEADRIGKEGAFSYPYIVTNGTLSISFGAKVYNQQLFAQGTKQLKGIARIVKPLSGISNFLSKKVQVFDQGFVIIKEHSNDNVIAGSINCTTFDEKSRLSIFDISDRNAGKLMKTLNTTVGDITTLPKGTSISSMGVDYLVRHVTYEFENIKWDVYIIVVTRDILQSTHISIGVSVAVSAFITLIGVAFSVLLSIIILRPITYLGKQFEFIKVFELDSVRHSNSMFSELNQVYTSLSMTVKWLKEIKAFVPESVFLQLQQNQIVEEPVVHEKKLQATSASIIVDKSVTSGGTSSFNGQNQSTDSGSFNKRGLFKLGLSHKECSVVHVRLGNFLKNYSHQTVSNIFPKVLSSISEAAKVFQCDYQVLGLDEFQIIIETKKKKSNLVAQELALKIRKGIDKINQQEKEYHIECFIGISTRSDSYVGNLGTKTSRVYSIISNACKMSQRLSFLASFYAIPIVVDHQTTNTEHFVIRPIDRIIPHISVFSSTNISSSNSVKDSMVDYSPQTIYEIIKESKVEGDEWMYELETKNKNQRILQYHSIFNLFNSENTSAENLREDLQEKKQYLEAYLMENIDDVPSKKLLRLIHSIEQQQEQHESVEHLLRGYHTKIREHLVEN